MRPRRAWRGCAEDAGSRDPMVWRQDGYLVWVAFCSSQRLREFPDTDAVDYPADPGYTLYHDYAAVDLGLIVGESA